jgi:hypothetical protein
MRGFSCGGGAFPPDRLAEILDLRQFEITGIEGQVFPTRPGIKPRRSRSADPAGKLAALE